MGHSGDVAELIGFEIAVHRVDMADAPAKNDKPAPAPEKAKKGGMGMVIIAGAAMLVLGAGATFFFLHSHKTSAAAAAPAAEAKPEPPKFTVHLEPFTVNLADVEQNHFLRITMDLGLEKAPAGADKGKEGAGDAIPTARIRDAVLSVLTVGKADELLTSEGKEKLKQDLLKAIDDKAPEIGVKEIYFTEFIVQR
jgi:flagellar protein FliL